MVKIVALNEVDTMNEITNNEKESYAHVNVNDSVLHLMNHPAFEGFGQFILPINNVRLDKGIQLKNVSALLPYHNHVNSDTTVGVINYMIDEVNEGKTIFYDFYTEQQKQEDPTKASTGLFFFRGDQGTPFAIVCPGGGFAYVGSIHEGFPQAIELSNKGYDAFVLKYHVGSEQRATEDLAAAIAYTGHASFSESYPPTFITVSEDDRIVNI